MHIFKTAGIFFFCFISFSLYAQEPEEEVVIVKLYDRSEDKIVIEFTNDMWLDLPAGVELRPYSPGFNFYLFSDYQFGESPLSFAWGLGMRSDNVHSNGTFVLHVDEETNDSEQILTPFPDDYEYEKNKFVSTYVELPVEFRLITEGKHPFRLITGFKVGYMVSNHHKIKDTEGKAKFYDFENINRFHYGVTAKIGYSFFAITGFYSLTPLINPSEGTPLIPYSIGIAIMPIK